MAIRKFQRGSSTYKCNVCTRTTRNVGSNGGCNLCPQCYDLAGIENEISDGHRTLTDALPTITPLVAEVAAKGGDVSDWQTTFDLKGGI